MINGIFCKLAVNFGKSTGTIFILLPTGPRSLWDVFHDSRNTLWFCILQRQSGVEVYCFSFLFCSASAGRGGPGERLCQMFKAWCICAALLHVLFSEYSSRCWLNSNRWRDAVTQEKTFLPAFSSSVDTGGGLVVVCMTSFTSMFGVTSYVRLLNCYMGHQHFHTFSLFGLNCFTGFSSDWCFFVCLMKMSFSLHKETEVGVCISFVISHVCTVSLAKY